MASITRAVDIQLWEEKATWPSNAKWPKRALGPAQIRDKTNELWGVVQDVIATDLGAMQSGVIPDDVKDANRAELMRMLDAQILGLLVSRAAAGGVKPDQFDDFLKRQLHALKDASNAHPLPIDERLAKADARYRFR